MGTWLATREDVKSSLDMKETARSNAQVDRAIEAASRAVEGFLHRVFAPTTATRYFDWPNQQYARAWRLWLEEFELISATTVTSGGTTIAAADYFLEPVNSGPPYDRLEIDLSSTAAFSSSSSTHQRSIAITGLWGYTNDTSSAGTVAEALDASETAVDVDGPAAAALGVGSVFSVDSERFAVTERSALDTTQTLQTALTASSSNVTVAVTTGSSFAVGEVILLDSERMLIVDIAGNNLTVKRAWDGSVLAAHTASAIYAYRTLTVTRAALGTTAATHSSGAAILRWNPPFTVRELVVAEAVNNIENEQSGYATVLRAGEGERKVSNAALVALRESARVSHGRNARSGAV